MTHNPNVYGYVNGKPVFSRTGYICPHCESRLRAGETLPNIQASQKARPQRTKGATL